MEAYRVFRTVAQRWPKEGNISQRLGTAAAEACKGIEQVNTHWHNPTDLCLYFPYRYCFCVSFLTTTSPCFLQQFCCAPQRAPEDIDDWRYMYAVIPGTVVLLARLLRLLLMLNTPSSFPSCCPSAHLCTILCLQPQTNGLNWQPWQTFGTLRHRSRGFPFSVPSSPLSLLKTANVRPSPSCSPQSCGCGTSLSL